MSISSTMAMLHSFIALALVTLTFACVAPDCDRPDFGTCGNACCKLMITFPGTPASKLVATLNDTLDNGGPDGRYSKSDLYEGVAGFANLKPFAIDVYIGQAHHLTEKKTFTDTINFNVANNMDADGQLKAFSISQIGGAYGDSGQNFKNIIGLVKGTGLKYTITSNEGCPAAAPAQ
eukprot:m.256924 g.256924  ORF g.256924 m.256924 type:complete len:177 (+) comp34830_c0_seq1:1-531(+)